MVAHRSPKPPVRVRVLLPLPSIYSYSCKGCMELFFWNSFPYFVKLGTNRRHLPFFLLNTCYTANALSSFSAAIKSFSIIKCVYISIVVRVVECPALADAVTTSTPFPIIIVILACLKLCSFISLNLYFFKKLLNFAETVLGRNVFSALPSQFVNSLSLSITPQLFLFLILPFFIF